MTRTRHPSRSPLAAVLLGGLLAASAGGASAAFTATTSSPGNSFAVVDTVAPTITRATTSRSTADSPGTVRQGAGYYTYGQVSDTRSGVGTLSATTSSFDAGGASVTMSSAGGPWTVGGQSYSHRSPLQTTLTPQRTGATRPWTLQATDRAGNTSNGSYATSIQRYRDAVLATPGLVRYYPLSDGSVSADEFTTGTATSLAGRTGSSDETWTELVAGTQVVPAGGGRIRKGAVAVSSAVTSAVPPSANYAVEADIAVQTLLDGSAPGVLGRVSGPSSSSFYQLRYMRSTGAFELWRQVDGTRTQLASYAQTLVAGTSYRLRLQMNGSTVRAYVDGVLRIDTTDSGISAAGRGGVVFGFSGSTARPTDTTGMHLDDFRVSTLTTTATNLVGGGGAGTSSGGPRLNSPGALVGDTDRATRFDGVDDRIDVPKPAAMKNDLSIELWFSSSRGGKGADGAQWWAGAGLVDGDTSLSSALDFGMSLLASGRIAFGAGDVTGKSPPGYDDGAWHHVVMTRTSSSGEMRLYVDGAAVTTATSTTAALTDTASLVLGAGKSPPNEKLTGTLDDVALYTTALPAATVLDHYEAGRGTG